MRLFSRRPPEWWATSLDVLQKLFVQPSKSGQPVNWTTAIRVAAVFACARVLADGVSTVPWKLYRTDGQRRVPAVDHPLYDVIAVKPNGWQTSFAYRETMMWHLVLAGRHTAFKNVVNGRLRELVPLEPGHVTVQRAADGTRSYLVTGADGRKEPFPQSAIWHVNGPSWNGWLGIDVVREAREAIGLSLATEEAHAALHKNGGQAGGVYSVDGTLSEQQHQVLSKWIQEHYTGGNRFRPLILDRAAKWSQSAMTGVDAEHLSTRRYQVEEVCRFLRVMPIMLGQAEKTATYASAEQMFQAHVVHSLMPWCVRLEQAADCELLTAEERAQGYYTRFNLSGLARGTLRDRYAAYKDGVLTGFMTRNEVRAFEELDWIDGLDEPLTPLNMQAAGDTPPAGDGGTGNAA